MNGELRNLPLPRGIRSRVVDNHNGLSMHVLEAGFETPGRPCLLLLHGFPELAFSWRKIMVPLAAAGYHVVAPDHRGYGRTTGSQAWDSADPSEFRLLNLARDALGLVFALGYRKVAGVIGHDVGSFVAAWCSLLRPDVFASAVLMSAPFGGPPRMPFGTATSDSAPQDSGIRSMADIVAELQTLNPPRKHYQWYYSGPQANDDMLNAKQGLHAFLRAYYHAKSGDWAANKPSPLTALTAEELVKLPTYYVMNANESMPETVAAQMPTAREVSECEWLPDADLAVYVDEYQRTGFQGCLGFYRCITDPRFGLEMQTWSNAAIQIPTCFIAGKSDWGIYQKPGDYEAMQTQACANFAGSHLIEGAGHWIQQEKPQAVLDHLLAFLKPN
jgi:pimeloyl-ACP methyl ester carboxylesterase